MNIEGSVALVTGANRGIGRALVEALLAYKAAHVYAAGRDRAALDKLVAAHPDRISAVPLDVTSPDQATRAAEKAGDVSLLFNNAGVLAAGNALHVSADDLRRHFDVNFYGLFNTTRAFAPVLKRNSGGGVINVLTLLSFASMPGFSAYNASKAAAWSLTQSLRADLGKQGTRVFNVFPGAIDTDMLAGIEMPKTAPSHVAEQVLAGLAADKEDIFPDPMSQQVYAQWSADHKAVERQFAAF